MYSWSKENRKNTSECWCYSSGYAKQWSRGMFQGRCGKIINNNLSFISHAQLKYLSSIITADNDIMHRSEYHFSRVIICQGSLRNKTCVQSSTAGRYGASCKIQSKIFHAITASSHRDHGNHRTNARCTENSNYHRPPCNPK